MRFRPGTAAAVACLTLVATGLVSCGGAGDVGEADPVGTPSDDTAVTTAPPPATEPAETATAPRDATGEARATLAALFLTPTEATHLTVTDFDAIRERLGVPDLSSEDLMTDRLEFWHRVPVATVLLTDGALREDNSLFDLRYGFTQDDVDWEAHWSGGASGLALQLRPDLDLEGAQRAVGEGVPALGQAPAVLEEHGTLVSGDRVASSSWAEDPGLLELTSLDAESLIVRRGCVPFLDALGIDATTDHLDALLGAHDVAGLLEVQAVATAFTRTSATVRLLYPEGTSPSEIEADLTARTALAADWPVVESIGFPDGFAVDRPGVDGPVGTAEHPVGAVRYPVTNPTAAAALALADLVPVGVCNEPGDLAEPTGL